METNVCYIIFNYVKANSKWMTVRSFVTLRTRNRLLFHFLFNWAAMCKVDIPYITTCLFSESSAVI